ncbi:MAG: hypothetical protein HYX78_13115 [Armatimonadetes bacterium]|nr:hypothetical protein [Armatimonadota bacterium]
MRTRWVLAFMAATALLWSGPAVAQATEDLQTEIRQIERQLEEMDDLKARLADLESRLETTEKQQKKAATGEKIKLSGYIQSRYTDEEDAAGTFNVSRARLKLSGHLTEKSAFIVEIDARSKDGKVELRDAYLDRFIGYEGKSYIRAGQFKVPVMYEVLESSSVRLAPERTAVARALFPGERDVGAVAVLELGSKSELNVGLLNGQGRNADDENNHKDIVARFLSPLARGTAYVGGYDGEFTKNGVTTDKKRLAVGAEQTLARLGLRAEFVTGENLGFDVAGWYAQAALPVGAAGATTLFARYDLYDENRDAADTTFKRTTLGIEHQLDTKSRLTLAYESRNPDAGFANIAGDSEAVDEDALTVQYQVKY